MFGLPEPLPSSDNPFQRISWMLFIAYVAGRELTRLRRDQVQTLGRLMRTERVGQTSYLHHEDDVSVRTDVERDLGQRLNDWPAALADARRLANLRGIPFVVVDDVLESAQSKLDAFWAIVQGVASGEMVYPDHLLTGRLKDLADSTSRPALAGQEVSATTPKTPTAVGPAKQSEWEKPDAPSAKQLLHGWRAIDEALGLSRSYPNMNYDERRRKLAYLNDYYGGPIRTGRKGSQPIVNRSELIAWWNSLEDQVEAQKARIRDKQATLQNRHQYGRTAQVAPDIGGSVKRRKSRSQT